VVVANGRVDDATGEELPVHTPCTWWHHSVCCGCDVWCVYPPPLCSDELFRCVPCFQACVLDCILDSLIFRSGVWRVLPFLMSLIISILHPLRC
jgi:hypothetical protein